MELKMTPNCRRKVLRFLLNFQEVAVRICLKNAAVVEFEELKAQAGLNQKLF
jgi:hypothetical protein